MLSRNRDYNLPGVNPFVCTIASSTITLHKHAAVTWLPKEDLAALDWAEADLPVPAFMTRSWTRLLQISCPGIRNCGRCLENWKARNRGPGMQNLYHKC